MNIEESANILKQQRSLQRTRKGRPIVEEALAVIDASLEDTKNWGSDVIICLNCGIILSSLLVPGGCVNCGSKDLSSNIS